MKKLVFALCLFSFAIMNAQITLDKAFPNYLIKTTLTRDGQKLYYFDYSTLTLTVLNTDYTVFKSFSVPDVGDEYCSVSYLSDSLFDTDEKLEFALEFWNTNDTTMVFNEDGDILLKCKGNLWSLIDADFIFGDITKFVIKGSDSTFVFSLPGKYEPLDPVAGSTQTLMYANGNLSISDGNTVDISSLNTDNQQLKLSNDTLYLSNGGSVFIGSDGSGVSEIALKANGLSNAYPVPAQNFVQVNYQLPATENSGTLEVISSTGAKIDEIYLDDASGVANIDLTNYTSGNYLLRLKTSSGFTSTKKTIVVK